MFNNNIRCIEILFMDIYLKIEATFNNNIRCIEMAANIAANATISGLITT